jgi:Outer membrane protein beta-barrel domain
MKRQILLIAAIALSSAVMAQSKISFGIRGGLTNSGMKGEAVDNLQNLVEVTNGMISTKNTSGYFAGAYTSIPVSEKVSIEPGIYYSKKGYELGGSLDLKGVEFLGVGAKLKLQSDYVDVPVLVKGNFNGFQVFGGPQVSYLTKADLQTKASVLGINLLNRSIDVTNEFNRWDAAITGGVGYQFANGFSVSAQYDHGLARVDKNKSVNSYNRAFKVGVGFQF